MQKNILFTVRSAPYGSSLAREALDAILAAAVYEQNLSVLFMDDGVFQLINHQQGDKIQQKNISSILQAFPLYDVEPIYVCLSSLQQRDIRIEDLAIDAILLEKKQLQSLISQQEALLCF